MSATSSITICPSTLKVRQVYKPWLEHISSLCVFTKPDIGSGYTVWNKGEIDARVSFTAFKNTIAS